MGNVSFLRASWRAALPVGAWALYDLANQFFALNIVSLYFVRWLTLDKGVPEFAFSAAFGISTFMVAILSPVLGAFADRSNRNRRLLIAFTLLAVGGTMLMGYTQNPAAALALFAFANFGCQIAGVFYNTLLKYVASERSLGLISGFGRMFGYSGALVALAVAKPLIARGGYHAIFFPTGLLFLVFALPCMLFVREPAPAKPDAAIPARPLAWPAAWPAAMRARDAARGIARQLRSLCGLLFRGGDPAISYFMKASFFGLCGLNAIMLFMSMYVTKVYGMNEDDLVKLMAHSTVFAIAGSVVSGFVSDRLGHVRCLRAVFVMWAAAFTCGALMRDPRYYLFVGALVGATLGSTWVVSRAVVIRLAPPAELGEIFGVFNLMAYLSAVAGALFWGGLAYLLRDWGAEGYRVILFSLNIFIVIGIVLLLRVPLQKGLRS